MPVHVHMDVHAFAYRCLCLSFVPACVCVCACGLQRVRARSYVSCAHVGTHAREKTFEHLHVCASRWVFVGILIGVLILIRGITYLGLRFVKHLDR